MVIVALMLVGCQQARRSQGEQVKLRLKWLYNASFAGEIWGKESGLFRQRGLEVRLLEGGPEQDAIKDLELGRVQFGIASADQVIRAVAKGAKIRVVAQVFQRNPLRWIYRADRLGEVTPAKLPGLTVGVTFGGNDEAIFQALLRRWSIKPSEVAIYGVHYDFTPFWKGRVDLWPVYYNTQGVVLAQKMKRNGHTPGFLDPDRWGIRFVANSLVTSERMVEENPGLVRRFTEAFLEAWRQAVDPARRRQVARAVHRYNPSVPVELIEEQLAATEELVRPPEGGRLGAIDRPAWLHTAELMRQAGLIQVPIDLGPILGPALP